MWASDKWKGVFKVRWIFVRDIPNANLRHIKLMYVETLRYPPCMRLTRVFLETHKNASLLRTAVIRRSSFRMQARTCCVSFSRIPPRRLYCRISLITRHVFLSLELYRNLNDLLKNVAASGGENEAAGAISGIPV